MVNLTSAEKALKTVYLGVVANQLNTGVNPFMAKIEQTTSDVWGKQIVKMVPYGLNGGVGAGTETGVLPVAAGNNYERFTLDLKNLYPTRRCARPCPAKARSSICSMRKWKDFSKHPNSIWAECSSATAAAS